MFRQDPQLTLGCPMESIKRSTPGNGNSIAFCLDQVALAFWMMRLRILRSARGEGAMRALCAATK
jgi:hypothetical protein